MRRSFACIESKTSFHTQTFLLKFYVFARKNPISDNRMRSDRVRLRHEQWQGQIPGLVDAYLAWKSGERPVDSPDGSASRETFTLDTVEYFGMSFLLIPSTELIRNYS